MVGRWFDPFDKAHGPEFIEWTSSPQVGIIDLT